MKRLAEQTLYEILEVREDAPAAEIQAACERARDLYGPASLAAYTLLTPDEAALLSKRIDEARATLLDPDARARYDEGLHRPDGVGAPAADEAAAATRPTPEAGGAPREPFAVSATEARPERPTLLPAPLGDGIARGKGPAAAPLARPILLQREVAPAAPARPAAAPAAPGPGPVAPLPVIPDDGWTGDALRQVREARGLTLQELAARTKVTRHHLENIEDERFGALPAPVYLRGILLSLARELRLDGQKVARAYLDRAAAALARK